MTVRVRFAPSPTGFLHVGGARTALYNWLFARHNKGTFILRIEDTDEVRSTDESLRAILDGMKWLGLDWDEGPYFQMQRAGVYKEHLQTLRGAEKAYPCFCTKEDLDQMRKRAMLLKRPPKYDGRCRRLDPAESARRIDKGEPHVFRFARPEEGRVEFTDAVKGTVRFESEQLDDFIIVKSSGTPTFMFAGAIDDYLMKISHVVRGDDHLSNTPRQLQLFDAFGWTEKPIFAHISMIHGPDNTRLSKRHGATSVEEYQKAGFLPEAMVNYLALLGWSTSDSQQLFDPGGHYKELIDKFELERCQKSPAIFDVEKLKWMNGVYIRNLSKEELWRRAKPFLESVLNGKSENYLREALALEQEKLTVFSEAAHLIDFFVAENLSFDPGAVEKVFKKEGAIDVLRNIQNEFTTLEPFTAESTEKACRNFAAKNNLKNGQVFHPVRVAVSGRTKGPSLFHMLEVMGKERVAQRIQKAVAAYS